MTRRTPPPSSPPPLAGELATGSGHGTAGGRRATVRTVADAAGVSVATVSRVLNGKEHGISSATQARVLAIARDLHYRPSSVAVSLRKQTTRTIGLVVPDISDAYFTLLARGVEDTAQAAGYAVIFSNTDRLPAKETMAVDLLCDKQVDGLIFAGGGVNDDRHLRARVWGNTKVVTLGPRKLPFPSITVDNRAAITAAVLHLASVGCKRIAAIGGKADWLIHRQRMMGYENGLRRAGLSLNPRLLWDGDFTIDAGARAVRDALSARLRFDGIVAFNDYSALGAMHTLRERGLDVPGDVAVTGCDDIPVASLVDPPLTTLAFPLYDFGVAAARTVLAMLEGVQVEKHTPMPFELRVRRSSVGTPT